MEYTSEFQHIQNQDVPPSTRQRVVVEQKEGHVGKPEIIIKEASKNDNGNFTVPVESPKLQIERLASENRFLYLRDSDITDIADRFKASPYRVYSFEKKISLPAKPGEEAGAKQEYRIATANINFFKEGKDFLITGSGFTKDGQGPDIDVIISFAGNGVLTISASRNSQDQASVDNREGLAEYAKNKYDVVADILTNLEAQLHVEAKILVNQGKASKELPAQIKAVQTALKLHKASLEEQAKREAKVLKEKTKKQ